MGTAMRVAVAMCTAMGFCMMILVASGLEFMTAAMFRDLLVHHLQQHGLGTYRSAVSSVTVEDMRLKRGEEFGDFSSTEAVNPRGHGGHSGFIHLFFPGDLRPRASWEPASQGTKAAFCFCRWFP
eukprot:Skav224164  [mRNA]  locus=scaffold2007:249937:257378:- [translate_table: standard]